MKSTSKPSTPKAPAAPCGEESHPLRWPEGQERTRHQDRHGRATWKQSMSKVRDALTKEMRLSGVTEYLITYNLDASLDAGVAVYFSRKTQDAFSWQEALGFIGQAPTRDEIERAYRERIKYVHTDRADGGDVEAFRALTKHRDRALDYIAGRHRAEHEYVLAIDEFDEVRLNLYAVRVVLNSLRRIDDCGSPLMMEKAFRGFHKQISAGEVAHESTVA